MTADLAAAPLAHRLPWLMGCSNQGSWLTQTPSLTSPIRPPPTAHLVQMVLYCASLGASTAAAEASRKMGFGTKEPAAPTPSPTPADFRNFRRSIKGFSVSTGELRSVSLSRTLRSVIPIPRAPPPPAPVRTPFRKLLPPP